MFESSLNQFVQPPQKHLGTRFYFTAGVLKKNSLRGQEFVKRASRRRADGCKLSALVELRRLFMSRPCQETRLAQSQNSSAMFSLSRNTLYDRKATKLPSLRILIA